MSTSQELPDVSTWLNDTPRTTACASAMPSAPDWLTMPIDCLRGGRDRRDVHERHAHVERRVHHADAVRPDDAHVAFARDRREALLLRDAVLLAGLRVARGEHDHAAHAGRGTFQHDLLDRLARRGDHGAVRHLRQCRDIRIAVLIADPLVARVHRIHPPAIVLQVHQHALAE